MKWLERWWHVHQWEETARLKITAVAAFKAESFAGNEDMLRTILAQMYDRTAVQLRCVKCGDVAARVLDGWAPMPLPAVTLKVEAATAGFKKT